MIPITFRFYKGNQFWTVIRNKAIQFEATEIDFEKGWVNIPNNPYQTYSFFSDTYLSLSDLLKDMKNKAQHIGGANS